MSHHLYVARRSLDPEQPWRIPDLCHPVPFVDAGRGNAPRQATGLIAYYDDRALYLLYLCDDESVRATLLRRDEPLYTEDVVEAFIAPRTETRYFEFEVNPRGTLFDAIVDSPEGRRESMHVDTAWDCEDLWAAVRRRESREAKTTEYLVAIPFASLGATPDSQSTWRANFFRVDRHDSGDEFTALSPTMRSPADFHVPDAFVPLVFE